MIVAIDHGGEIALHIPLKLERMVSTGKACFEIAQHSINPLELGQISGFATIGNDNCMGTAGIRYAVEARESIGQHLALGIECSARPAFYCGTGKARNHRKSRIDGMALCIYRDGGHKVDFVLGTSSDLAASIFPAQIGIIGLYSALQGIDFLAFEHRLHQLVVDAPSRGVADSQLSHQGGECGQTRLSLTNQVNGEKPSRQGQAGALKEGSGNPGSLMTTLAALKRLARTAFQNRMPDTATLGTENPFKQWAFSSAAVHCSSLPKRRRNSGRDKPFWNCTRFIAMTISI